MKLLPVVTSIFAIILASCSSTKHWHEKPYYEIEVRDPKGVLSGTNAQLTVSSRPHPMSFSARASDYYSESENLFRIEHLLHDQRSGWLLASPNIRAPYSKVEQYVFEFQFHRPRNSSSWSEWIPVTFMTIGGSEWDLIYKTGREERFQPLANTGLLMRHRTSTWAERQKRQIEESYPFNLQ